MRLLLDSHSFLWFVLHDAQPSAPARTAISDPANDLLVSPATHWEIAVKVSKAKYTLSVPYQDFIQHNHDANDFEILPFEVRHTAWWRQCRSTTRIRLTGC